MPVLLGGRLVSLAVKSLDEFTHKDFVYFYCIVKPQKINYGIICS